METVEVMRAPGAITWENVLPVKVLENALESFQGQRAQASLQSVSLVQ